MLTYGWKDNRLAHVSNVENGKKCGCVSPLKRLPLVAKNNPNNRKKPHFSLLHHEEAESFETFVHILAKQIIQEEKFLTTPPSKLFFEGGRELQVGRPASLSINNIESEQRIENSGFVADNIIQSKEGLFVVEWQNTHRSTEEKITFLKENRIPAIEIDISEFCYEMTHDEIVNWLLNDAPRVWIYDPRTSKEKLANWGLNVTRKPAYEAVRFFKTRNGVKAVNQTWVKNCPTKGFDGITSTRRCHFCPFAYYVEYWEASYVDCAAHSRDLVKKKILESTNTQELLEMKEITYDGSDWYENAKPNLGNGFKKGWDAHSILEKRII
ncbi:MAG: hypothetical protein ACSHYA_01140 [Opitutaceae bacterium]